MSSYGALRTSALALFAALGDVAERRRVGPVRDRLTAAAAHLEQDSLTVMICGEFKRGKSSLLNALLDECEPPLFPVDAKVTTSAVTVVSWAPTESVVVEIRRPDGSAEQRPIDRSEISAYAAEGGQRAGDGVAVVRIGTPHPGILSSRLTLVDTPGVGGVFTAHTAATMAFLPSADAVVFVGDFTQPLLRSELVFLQVAAAAMQAVGDDDSALLCVLTKSDLVTEAAQTELLADATVKIAAAIGQDPARVTMVPVSSAAKADYLEYGDTEDLASSNFPRFEALLWGAVTRRRARMYLAKALGELHAAAGALLRPLDDELAALVATTERRLAELLAQSTDRRAALERLRSDGAAWRIELQLAMSAVGRGLHEDARRLLNDVWVRCDGLYLPEAVRSGDVRGLSERLKADLGVLAGTLGELARRRSGQVLREFALRHGLQLANPRLDALPAPDPPAIAPLPVGRVAARYLGDARRFTEGLDIGRNIAAAVGGVLDVIVPGVGTVIGGLLDKATQVLFGALNAMAGDGRRAAARQERVAHLRLELDGLRARHVDDFDAGLDALVEELMVNVAADLDDRIAREIGSVEESLHRVASARERTAAAAAQHRRRIDRERTALLQLLDQVNELAGEVQRVSGR